MLEDARALILCQLGLFNSIEDFKTEANGLIYQIFLSLKISVTNGAVTDATLIGPENTPVKFVWGHGLGSKDPELRTRFNDGASNVTFSAMEEAGAR